MAGEWLHVWSGMTLSAWLRLLRRNRFAVSPARLPRAALMTAAALGNSYFARMQERRYGRRIAGTGLAAAPLFIIGHWRSGTTFLHELLALDEGFLWPNAYECFAPGHFLVTQGWGRRHLARYLPATRPMDAMAFGFDRPQEDEFALLNLGLGSPYETLAFPNRRPGGAEYLDPARLSDDERAAWQSGLLHFLHAVQLRAERRDPAAAKKRMLLNSPTHTARLAVLRALFPDAAFVHLVRDPYELFASTRRLWTVLFAREGLQTPRLGVLKGGVPTLDDYIFAMLDQLYCDFSQQAALIPAQQFCEVRYEDLAARPLDTLEFLYDRLALGDFLAMRGKIERHLAGLDHVPNRHCLSAEEKTEIRRRWSAYFDRYGY
ncbi:MAG: sulfotransferase family protein [Stellaceae bacterium]